MRITHGLLAASLTLTTLVAAAPSDLSLSAGPIDDVATAIDGEACDDLDPSMCLFPFPNDRFTKPAATATGRQVDLEMLAMPRNSAGRPIDPTEWNRNDGFSPGAMLVTYIEDLDLQATWDLPDGVLQLDRPSLSLSDDAPIVVIDAATGERHPFWSELDTHPGTGDDERVLIIRPLVNFEEGHRYIVALRDLVDGSGSTIEAGPAFAALRDGSATGRRAQHFDSIFADLADAGVDRDELFLAWDFTVASEQNLAGRALHIRDDAFSQLGDTDLADRVIDGVSPTFTIDRVTDYADGATARRVEGTVTVPNYLDRGQDETRTPEIDDPTGEAEDAPAVMVPLSRFKYDTPLPGVADLPIQNEEFPTLEAGFTCNIPALATATTPATPTLYGHGLLGGKGEANGSSSERMRERNHLICGVDWAGMETADLGTVALLLADQSNFASLPDRAQQGFLNFMFVGRTLIHPDGFSADPAFQDADGTPLFDPSELVYDGNSQGGIMGGALTALSPDITKATLGVFGMNYSTLLNRSVDWEGAYGEISYAFYPDKREQQLMFALIQMLWDRGETNGYAHHLTDDTYPNTPTHQVMIHVAYGDYQVANVSAEVGARTAGIPFLQNSMSTARHWSDDATFAFDLFDAKGNSGKLHPATSAFVYWDSGNPTPPSGNIPPEDLGHDPHSDPRKDHESATQRERFYADGLVYDVHEGGPYLTYKFPERCPDLETPEPGSPC